MLLVLNELKRRGSNRIPIIRNEFQNEDELRDQVIKGGEKRAYAI